MVWHDLRIHHKPRPDHWTVFLDSPRYAPTRTISRYRTTARAPGAARSHPARDRPDSVGRFRPGRKKMVPAERNEGYALRAVMPLSTSGLFNVNERTPPKMRDRISPPMGPIWN